MTSACDVTRQPREGLKCACTRDVDLSGQRDVALSDSGQHGRVVDQPVDVVVDHDLLEVFIVEDVGEDERTCAQEFSC